MFFPRMSDGAPRSVIEYNVYVARIDLELIGKYGEEADVHFMRLVEEHENELPSDVGKITVDQAWEGDRRVRLGEVVAASSVLMIFSIWEMFLTALYTHARMVATIPELRGMRFSIDSRHRSASEHIRYFDELQVNTSDIDWNGLRVLQEIRNTIIHHGGNASPALMKELLGYDKKHGLTLMNSGSLTLSMEYVRHAILLLVDSVEELGDQLLATFKSLGIVKSWE